MRSLTIALLLLLLPVLAGAAPTPLATVFGSGSRYDAAVPTPRALLGFEPGERAASPEEIHAAITAWADASPRAKLLPYGRTHQSRPLRVVAISSPANIARLDEIRGELAELADPRRTDSGRADRIVESAPAVGFLGYSIHGNETSGADAALALVYHLLASEDADVEDLLAGTVVLIDPLLNPDGRARAVADLRSFSGSEPVYDDQHLGRGASWPYGRGNHYVFDLNRDWLFATQPETRGRVELLRDWYPLLFVDAHEMGAQDTFLFSPPRAPLNPFLSPHFAPLVERIAQDQAAEFDRRGWLYYSGEWNEGWYPGYSDAWAALRGSAGMLYEQARVAEHGVLQANQQVLTYAEAVSRQLASSWSNIRTLAAQRRALLDAFRADRAASLQVAQRSYIVPGDQSPSRLARLADILEMQGVEAATLAQATRVAGAVAPGGARRDATVPAGSIVVAARQPLARVVANLFEPDLRIDRASLLKEREELLRDGESTIYDVTAWNLPMLLGLRMLVSDGAAPAGDRLVASPVAGVEVPPVSAVGYAIAGGDDASVAAAAALLREGLRPRVAHKPLELDGRAFPRGTLVLTAFDHRDRDANALHAAIARVAPLLREPVHAIGSGRGPGDVPDLGGGELTLLQPPRVALLGHGSTDANGFGFAWHYLDRELGLAPTLLSEGLLTRADLRRYDVIVMPERWSPLPDQSVDALMAWVDSGGTLVALGNASPPLADSEGPAGARTLRAALKDPVPYRAALAREWRVAALEGTGPGEDWSHRVASADPNAWPDAFEEDKSKPDERIASDRWRELFMPQGALVAARCDARHWLSFGCEGSMPVLMRRNEPLMAADAVQAPFRLGVMAPAAGAEWRRYGWAGIPAGQTLELRMAGLLWPEAQERLANTAWVTRESRGRGQIVLFASSPVFRGIATGMQRVLGNAVVYGPSLGASPVITR